MMLSEAQLTGKVYSINHDFFNFNQDNSDIDKYETNVSSIISYFNF